MEDNFSMDAGGGAGGGGSGCNASNGKGGSGSNASTGSDHNASDRQQQQMKPRLIARRRSPPAVRPGTGPQPRGWGLLL